MMIRKRIEHDVKTGKKDIQWHNYIYIYIYISQPLGLQQ